MKRRAQVLSLVLVCLGGCTSPSSGPATRPALRTLFEPSAPKRPTTQAVAIARPEPVILEPSQGRPIILRPGDRFYFLMRLGGSLDEDILVTLVHSKAPEVYFPISLAEELQIEPGRHASMILRVPADAPEGLYDVRVRGGGHTLNAARSVKVVSEFRKQFRFVHLSDMNIGDPTAPEFDSRLIDEVNLLAPEFIIATGNYIDPNVAGGGDKAWRATLAFFARFDAPVYIVCGLLDDEHTFIPTVAASQIGAFTYGGCHGVLLLNNSRRPMDAGQIDFVRRELAENRQKTFSFLVSSDDNPAFLTKLAQNESVPEFLRANRIRLLLCGGTSDWDGREYADEIARLPGLHYVRTHPASTCRTGRATGVSHYRVVEVNGEEITYVYPADEPAGTRQQSIPVGMLGVSGLPGGDTLPATVTVQVRNGLNQPFADCRLWIHLPKNGNRQPAVAGGVLKQTLDCRTHWACQIGFDLPDRGGIQIAASVEGLVPPPLPVNVEIASPDRLTFARATAGKGFEYAASGDAMSVTIRNRSGETLDLRPVVRLNGAVLPLANPTEIGWPVRLGGNQSVSLPVRLLLPSLIEGPHYVQVSFLEDPLRRLFLRRVELTLGPGATQPAKQP